MSHLARWDVEYTPVSTGEQESHLWKTNQEVLKLIFMARPGDDFTFHRLDDAEEGVEYA